MSAHTLESPSLLSPAVQAQLLSFEHSNDLAFLQLRLMRTFSLRLIPNFVAMV